MYYHNSSRNTILEEQTPMSFTMQLPTYQVETKSGSTLFPSHAEANNHYQKDDLIIFDKAVGGITANQVYYIVSINSTGFKISSTNGGNAIALADATLSNPMFVYNYYLIIKR